MTGKQNQPRDLSAIGGDPSRRRGIWKHIGGSPSDDCNKRLAVATMAATRPEPDARAREDQLPAAANGPIGIAPQDELEAMMAAQILAVHDAAMTCYRSAAEASDAPGRRDELVIADRLARTLAALVATERRYYRGKARRAITVDYVRVEPDAGAPAATIGGIRTLLGI
jgi:hypothetical protein